MLIIGNSVFTISYWRKTGENTVHGLTPKDVSTKLPLEREQYCTKEAIQKTMRPT